MHNTEDKQWWLQHGEALEEKFVEVCNYLGINAQINPAKTEEATAPDLVVNGIVADLKTQNTPFFTTEKSFGIPPRYAFSFNRKDYERYQEFYPNIDIYVWIDWQMTSSDYGITVDYLYGIYQLPFREVARLIEEGAPEHTYRKRTGDQDGNAKSSFMLDIRKFKKIYEIDKVPDFSQPVTDNK